MSLTDLMSGAGLSHYAIVALILFFGAFIALAAWTWWPSHKGWWSDAANIPLDDATTPSSTTAPAEAL
ncbi:MAG: CcoQ/FixQ family Cbb3-type cytochrome c oxidase assembly chaperone [Gemmatimonadaceae bacterium]|nr:CcoQ/FixQ family Cbb3-type cytochrome c oxidase assembly chaperone [Gemmatimonadaceae bacterium]